MNTKRIVQFTNLDGLPIVFDANTVQVISRVKKRERSGPKPDDIKVTGEVTAIMTESPDGNPGEIIVTEEFEVVKKSIWPDAASLH